MGEETLASGVAGLSFCALLILNGSFLFMGTISTVTGKMMYQTAVPIDASGREELFEKPWFQVWGMFLAMLLCGPILAVYRGCQRCRGRTNLKPLVVGKPIWQVGLVIFVPSLCDLLATVFQNVALLFTNVSIWQMLRGSTPIFTAMIRYFLLGKKTRSHEVWGVGLVMLGLCIVGLASFVSPSSMGGDVTNEVPWTLKLLGIGLVLLAQCTQAFQMVIEEHLLQNVETDALYIVFMEGFWGFLLATLCFMPLAQAMPGQDGGGIHEDVWPQEYYSIVHSKSLQCIVAVYVFVIMLYNVTGMWITEATEATTRNVMDAGRTLCVWLFTLAMNVVAPQYGEKIGWFSVIELVGFIVLMLGMFVYYKTIQLPWIRKGGPDDLMTAFMSPQQSPDPFGFVSPGPQPALGLPAARAGRQSQNKVSPITGCGESGENTEISYHEEVLH